MKTGVDELADWKFGWPKNVVVDACVETAERVVMAEEESWSIRQTDLSDPVSSNLASRAWPPPTQQPRIN
jgi:hypothetical protein